MRKNSEEAPPTSDMLSANGVTSTRELNRRRAQGRCAYRARCVNPRYSRAMGPAVRCGVASGMATRKDGTSSLGSAAVMADAAYQIDLFCLDIYDILFNPENDSTSDCGPIHRGHSAPFGLRRRGGMRRDRVLHHLGSVAARSWWHCACGFAQA